MAIKGRKFSKQHLANLRAAHAKRRGKKRNTILTAKGLKEAIITASFDKDKGEWLAKADQVIDLVRSHKPNGLIDRMTQAIDKLETIIERLETL